MDYKARAEQAIAQYGVRGQYANAAALTSYKSMRGAEHATEAGDCAVRALHMATALSYSEAHALLARHGRKHGNATSFAAVYVPAAEEAGLKRHATRAKTLGQFLKAEGARGVWVVGMTGHFATYVDGKNVSDQADSGARTRVYSQYRYIWKAAD